LFNGRRWWQDLDFTVHYSMKEYVRDRLTTVDIPKATKSRAKAKSAAASNSSANETTPGDQQPSARSSSLEIVSYQEPRAVCTVPTGLPDGVTWGEVIARRVINADTQEEILPWQNISDLSADDLHQELPREMIAAVRVDYRIDTALREESKIDLTDEQSTQLRGSIAGLSWAARQGRPDLSAPASTIASCYPTPKREHARAANVAVERARQVDVIMTLWPFEESDLRRLCIQDSAFDPHGRQKSQHGWMIGYTTPALARGERAPVSFVHWNSKKLRRKANSSLLCEAQSANISTGKWLQSANMEMSLRFASFRTNDSLYDHEPEAPTVLTKRTRKAVDPSGMLVMDAKSLFDAIHNEQAGQDDARSALESSMIKEDLDKLGAIARWIPHDRNPTDALTKHEGAHSAPLYAILRDHHWKLRHEDEELAERAKAREITGKANSRPKQGWKDMGNYLVDVASTLWCRRRNFERLTS